MFSLRKNKGRRNSRRPSLYPKFSVHPLFLLVGAWYSLTGGLFGFLMSCIVAVQHEFAHAFAASKLGYRLNRIVLMPYGAVIDGEMKDVSFKDEAYIALCGPLCNLLTAGFFVALWWCYPDAYAYTDLACFSSLAVALCNLLPAYPLDGGRILKCALFKLFLRRFSPFVAEKRAKRVCLFVTILFSLAFLGVFTATCISRQPNYSALAFGIFLLFGGVGNGEKTAVYEKLDFSCKDAFLRGVEVRRVAISEDKPVKDTIKYLQSGSYLVLEVYDKNEQKRFEITQNELSDAFLCSATPYTPLKMLRRDKKC